MQNNQVSLSLDNQESSQQSTITQPPITTKIPILYEFKSHTFTTAGKSGPIGPTLTEIKQAYSSVSWAQNSEFLNMTKQGIQEWTVPGTGNYKIRAVGAGAPYNNSLNTNGMNEFQKGMDATITTSLTKGEVIRILVGQIPKKSDSFELIGGAGGTFVCYKEGNRPIIVTGGGGGRGNKKAIITSNAIDTNSGNRGDGEGLFSPNNIINNGYGYGGENGYGGGGANLAAGGGGLLDNGINSNYVAAGGYSFKNGGEGGKKFNTIEYPNSEGGFGGGGAAAGGGGGGGGGYSGGGGGGNSSLWSSGGGGGSYSITGKFESAVANNNDNGFVIINADF